MPLEQQFGPISHWKIRVRSHNASHNFLGKMTLKSGLPIHHTKNLLLGKSKVNASQRMTTEATRSSCMGQKSMQPGHTCRQQRQNSLAFSQTTVFRSQQTINNFQISCHQLRHRRMSICSNRMDTSMGSGQQIKSNTTQTKRKAKPPLCFQSMHASKGKLQR